MESDRDTCEVRLAIHREEGTAGEKETLLETSQESGRDYKGGRQSNLVSIL